ncbi:hypothetical protein ACIBG8_00830 [Nonomuraea sp. NPDC050556]|uniref:hypothetical protein n=1 Tax=Nonomuraea sp. NPDC050556 TaxID=3364369 RepID=UPI0037983689
MSTECNRLHIGVFSPSVLIRVARRVGLLKEYDLSVEEVPVPSSPAQFAALLDGRLDAALTSPDNVLNHRFTGGAELPNGSFTGGGVMLNRASTTGALLPDEVLTGGTQLLDGTLAGATELPGASSAGGGEMLDGVSTSGPEQPDASFTGRGEVSDGSFIGRAGVPDGSFTGSPNHPHNPAIQADVRILSAVDRGLGLALYASPELSTSPPIMRPGLTLGVDVPNSGFAFAAYVLMETLGLSRTDYQVTALGSTPMRLDALLAGRCDITMLNAGNDLRAEDAGATRLAGVADHCGPYLGTVLATAGAPKPLVSALAKALIATTDLILSGEVNEVAEQETGLPKHLATRYVRHLTNPHEGLVRDGRVDPTAMHTVLALRRRYHPDDRLTAALDPSNGLITPHP